MFLYLSPHSPQLRCERLQCQAPFSSLEVALEMDECLTGPDNKAARLNVIQQYSSSVYYYPEDGPDATVVGVCYAVYWVFALGMLQSNSMDDAKTDGCCAGPHSFAGCLCVASPLVAGRAAVDIPPAGCKHAKSRDLRPTSRVGQLSVIPPPSSPPPPPPPPPPPAAMAG
jgi:hypothetical protein